MEMFNVHRRDLLNFDEFMNLKNPGFGGPSSAIAERDAKGKKINKGEVKLDGYRNVVERHPAFSHEVFDPTYKAMGGDLVHKQEVGENPYDYPDRYENMGIPVVEVGERNDESFSACMSFDEFQLNEQQVAPAPAEVEAPPKEKERKDRGNRPPRRRVNPAPKNVEGDDMDSLIDELMTELDISREEAAFLLSDGEADSEFDTEEDFSYEEDFENEYQMGSMGDSGCGCNP